MALVLSLRSGEDFYIGNQRVAVMGMPSPQATKLKVGAEKPKTVTQSEWINLLGNVKVRLGLSRNPESKVVRMMIEAPGKKVMRGSIYRKNGGQCSTCNGKKVLHDRVPCKNAKCGPGCTCKGTGFIKQDFKCPDCS